MFNTKTRIAPSLSLSTSLSLPSNSPPSPSLPGFTSCTDFGGTDPAWAYTSFVAFVLFIIEIISTSLVTPGYWNWPELSHLFYDPEEPKDLITRLLYVVPGSFYFWLDLISTASLIFEIPILLAFFMPEDTNVETADASGSGSGR